MYGKPFRNQPLFTILYHKSENVFIAIAVRFLKRFFRCNCFNLAMQVVILTLWQRRYRFALFECSRLVWTRFCTSLTK